MHTPRNIQSPYTASDFWNQWSSVTPRMALFIKVTPKAFWSGVSALGFTSNTRDMTLPGHAGITFTSSPGITPSAVEQALDNATSLEMTGIYQSSSFTHADVMSGKWDFATVEIFSACWDNVNLGELVHFKGNLGEFKDYQLYFTAEGQGLIARLSSDAGKVASRACRVKEFRNAECGHTAATVTVDGNTYDIVQNITDVNSVTKSRIDINKTQWTAASPSAKPIPYNGFYTNGKITYTSGDNNGVSREISWNNYFTAQNKVGIFLKRPLPYTPKTSDTFTLTAGCNRTVENCKMFSNIVNFRAEPFVPGLEAISYIPPVTE